MSTSRLFYAFSIFVASTMVVSSVMAVPAIHKGADNTSLVFKEGATEVVSIESDGKVGIGTLTPATLLEVAGAITLGDTAATCDVSVEGALRYNTGNVEYCDGSTWGALGGGTSTADADADTQIQVEESADDDTIRFDTAGVERLIIGATGVIDAKEIIKLDNETGGTGVGGSAAAGALSSLVDVNAGSPTDGQGLVWNNTASEWQAGSAGASSIDDLSDGKADATSVFLGNNAGIVDDGTANLNTALGIDALMANTNGAYNTAVGANALSSSQAAGANTAVGANALLSNTGSSNTALGAFSMSDNTSGRENVAIGSGALRSNTTNQGHVAVGHNALTSNLGGSINTAVGRYALQANTTGDYNVSLGAYSQYENISGRNNTSAGSFALRNNETGTGNIGIGYEAAWGSVSGSGNVAIGEGAMVGRPGATYETYTGSSGNVVIGSSAGYKMGDSMSYNIFMGYRAGNNQTAGSDNILIGSYVNALNLTNDDQLNIGNTIYGDLDNDRIGVGVTTTLTEALEVNGNVKATNYIVTSDRTFKEDIETIDNSLNKIAKLRGVTYNFKPSDERKFPEGKQVGLIAQEVEEIFPELVMGEEGNKAVNYAALVSPLIEAVKELKAENEDLRKRLEMLEAK